MPESVPPARRASLGRRGPEREEREHRKATVVRGRVRRSPPGAIARRASTWPALVLLVRNDPFDRLDQTVLGPAGDLRVRRPVDRRPDDGVKRTASEPALVTAARRLPGFGVTSWIVRVPRAARRARSARVVGEMLVERPAERDVHHLHASADAERGQGDPIGGSEQLDLELVPVRLDPVEVFARLLPRTARGRCRHRRRGAGRRRARGSPRARPPRRERRSRFGLPLAGARRGRGSGRRTRPPATERRGRPRGGMPPRRSGVGTGARPRRRV